MSKIGKCGSSQHLLCASLVCMYMHMYMCACVQRRCLDSLPGGRTVVDICTGSIAGCMLCCRGTRVFAGPAAAGFLSPRRQSGQRLFQGNSICRQEGCLQVRHLFSFASGRHYFACVIIPLTAIAATPTPAVCRPARVRLVSVWRRKAHCLLPMAIVFRLGCFRHDSLQPASKHGSILSASRGLHP